MHGIVLAGGHSSRMGTSKAALDWHGTPLMHRTASILGRVADLVVVVAAPHQPLPVLPIGVSVVTDAQEGLGPLQGMATGLHAIADLGREKSGIVFVCATDLPLLHPSFIESMTDQIGGAAIAVLGSEGHRHPLAGAYRLEVMPRLDVLLAAGHLRVSDLLDDEDVRIVGTKDVAHPESVRNANTPAEFEALRELPQPLVRVTGMSDGGDQEPPLVVRAANVGGLLAALDLPSTAPIFVDGFDASGDPAYALVEGDEVAIGR